MGWDYVFVQLWPLAGTLPIPQMMIHESIWSSVGMMILTWENRRATTLSTTNPIQTNQGANLSLHGEKLTTNRLRYSTAIMSYRTAISYLQAYYESSRLGAQYLNHKICFLFAEKNRNCSSNHLELTSHGKGDATYLLGGRRRSFKRD